MSIQKYEAFLKIIEFGNITKAAIEMDYSQSAISHILNSLESDLNIKLLNRDRQGIRLTAEGEAVLPVIQDIVHRNNELLNMISELHALERGTIRVGVFQSILNTLFPDVIKSFSMRYPEIQFDIRQGGYQFVENLILDGKVDCGFIQLPTKTQLDYIELFKDPLCAVFPPGTRPEQTRFPVADLDQESFIMVKEIDLEVLEILKANNIRLVKKYNLDTDYSVLPMVANGLGMCILPELLLQESPYELEVKELDPPSYRTLGIGFKKDLLSSATKKFIDHVIDQLTNE